MKALLLTLVLGIATPAVSYASGASSLQKFEAILKLWKGVKWTKPAHYSHGMDGKGFFVKSATISKGADDDVTFGDKLKKEGWLFVDDLAADGPDGGTVGFRKGDSLVVVDRGCPEGESPKHDCGGYEVKFTVSK